MRIPQVSVTGAVVLALLLSAHTSNLFGGEVAACLVSGLPQMGRLSQDQTRKPVRPIDVWTEKVKPITKTNIVVRLGNIELVQVPQPTADSEDRAAVPFDAGVILPPIPNPSPAPAISVTFAIRRRESDQKGVSR